MALKYILDAGTIAQYPRILAHGGAGNLLVPQAVVDEIRGRQARGLRADIGDLLDRAIDMGAVVVAASGDTMASLALELASESGAGNVRVVTSDRGIIQALASQGVAAVGASRFLSELSVTASDAGLEEAAERIVAAQRRHLVVGLLVAAMVTATAIGIVLNHQLIFHTTPKWFIPVLLMLTAALFFWWRGRHRLSYGLFEVTIGLLIASQSVVVLPAPYEMTAAKSIQFIGGLYIMVRGFDSLDLSIEDTSLGGWWRRLFHGGR
jgi:hypothetical protein